MTDNMLFILQDKPWQVMRKLEVNSGESEIYLVCHDQDVKVLKLYKEGLEQDEDVLNMVYNMDFEMLMPLRDYGKLKVNGVERYYELTDHLVEGTLKDYSLPKGDLKQFRRIALQAAAAIQYLHQNDIVHLDITPSNIFFTDKEHKSIVLGDYGICKKCEPEMQIYVEQARTPQYAAPEMYSVIDGKIRIGQEADFYSLGIVLLTLWLGRSVFSMDEHETARQKLQGRVPFVTLLPQEVKRLITGLTMPDPQLRWGYNEVELWFSNPESDVDEVKSSLVLKKVGEEMALLITNSQDETDERLPEILYDYMNEDGMLINSLKERGWDNWLSRVRQIVDVTHPDNRQRATVYTVRTAAYKLCCLFGVTPVYRMPDGKELRLPEDLNKKNKNDYRQQLRRSVLADWLSVFYHENPHADFSAPYSYERKVEEWLNLIGEYDGNNEYYLRYYDAKVQLKEEAEKTVSEYERVNSKDRMWKSLFIASLIIWLALVVITGFSDSTRKFLLGHTLFSIMLPVGGMSALIAVVHGYFKGLSTTPCFFMGIVGFLSSAIPVVALRTVQDSNPSLFVPAMVVLTLIYAAIAFLTDYHKGRSDRSDDLALATLHSDQNDLVEPLYYALCSKSQSYHSPRQAIIEDLNDSLSSMAGENVLHYKLWSILVMIVIALMVLFNKDLIGIDNLDLPSWRFNPIKLFHNIVQGLR